MARYRVSREQSQVTATVKATFHQITVVAKHLTGSFSADVADGKLAGAAPAGDFEVRASDLSAGNVLFDLDLHRTLDAKKFPLVTGTIRGVDATEVPGEYAVEGELKLHGVSQPVSGRVAIKPAAGGSLALEATMSIRLADFGIQPRRMLLMTVDPQVDIVAHLLAEPVP